jgi:hypothetical protein
MPLIPLILVVVWSLVWWAAAWLTEADKEG